MECPYVKKLLYTKDLVWCIMQMPCFHADAATHVGCSREQDCVVMKQHNTSFVAQQMFSATQLSLPSQAAVMHVLVLVLVGLILVVLSSNTCCIADVTWITLKQWHQLHDSHVLLHLFCVQSALRHPATDCWAWPDWVASQHRVRQGGLDPRSCLSRGLKGAGSYPVNRSIPIPW